MIEFRLPSLGSDMERGRLLEWRVRPGDAVHRGDVVAVVDTSKAAIDVEIWDEGTVHALLIDPDQTVPVGTPILALLAPGEAAAPEEAAAPAGASPDRPDGARAPVAATAARPAPAEGSAAAPGAAVPRADLAGGAAPVPSTDAPRAAAGAAPAQPARRRISPAARKHAEELGIDLASVVGTGPGDAVTLEDVERAGARAAARTAAVDADRTRAPTPAAASGEAPRAASAAQRSAEMRRTIAAAMTRAKREIPHYYLATDIALERASAWLARANQDRPIGGRLLMAVLLVKAVALAAKRYPELNGFWRNDAFEPGAGVHIGVAISLRQGGLVAPALLDADTLGLDALMAGLADLVRRARAFSLRGRELSAPSITVTNLGDQGVDLVQPVIYPPQVAIVGFGRPSIRPWVEGNALKLIPVVTASLAADHRASDGHRGALFLAAVRDLLQTPESL